MTNDKLKNFVTSAWETVLANKKNVSTSECDVTTGVGHQLQLEADVKFTHLVINEIAVGEQKPMVQILLGKTKCKKIIIAGLLCNDETSYVSSESIIFEYNGNITDEIIDQMLARIFVEQFTYMMMELKDLSQKETDVMISALTEIFTENTTIRELVNGCENRDIIKKTPTCERYVKYVVYVKSDKVTKIKK